jgi:hypothetical protein
MQINLKDVDSTPRNYIKKEGRYTLKCVAINETSKTSKGNTILKIMFQNREGEYFIEDIVITENTLFRVKMIADAFGYQQEIVNTQDFVGMYLVGFITIEKVKNKHDQIVDIAKCKSYSKSAKIVNTIPSAYDPEVQYDNEAIGETEDIEDIEIPF